MNILTEKERDELVEKLSYFDLDVHSYEHIASSLLTDYDVDYLIFDAAYFCLSKGGISRGAIDTRFDISRIRTVGIISHLVKARIESYIYNDSNPNLEGIDNLLFEYLQDKKIGLSPIFIRQFVKENREEIDIIRKLRLEEEERKIFLQDKEQAKKKILEKERKKAAHNEALQELIEEGLVFVARKRNEKSREPIPKEVMNQVWNRDGGACVQCGSKESLEFDHIIPVSKGGATTYRNLQLLCKSCNLKKSNNIG